MGDGTPIRYEVVFDCRDRLAGDRLCRELESIAADAAVRRADEGPTWAVTMEFATEDEANRFFRSEEYRQFCMDVRRTSQTSVLVVPLGQPDESG